MSKKSIDYKGYILLEGLVSFGIMGIIVGIFMSSSTFLLSKKAKATDELTLHRILYEEMKNYENHGGGMQKKVQLNGRTYSFYIYKTKNKIDKVVITDAKEQFSLEQK
ncbi:MULTISPECIES: competence type IV pilus minor pilin ComGE [unclassified Enterococcus]|uniref:competence type IV pilus minor pilin ComGE n=1 Tax=unclassified Enterococcus TaxID=2608891 RepID=UPI001CE1A049|nr:MULTISPECIES: competence type IV pilus minor pilin ComGE [unclassified Enterococcus]